MKTSLLFAAAMALVATGACKKATLPASIADTEKPSAPVPPPANGDWSSMVTTTPAGGFKMGNPAAKVQLVEYGSLTCPHCAEFDEKGVPSLLANYVKNGKVAWEYRNFVRDPFDVTAALTARCGGTAGFFGLMRGLYADQVKWMGKLQASDPKQAEAIDAMAPDQQFKARAAMVDFYPFAAMRGIDKAKLDQCLSNQQEVAKLVEMQSDAVSTYNIPGTPTFLINGKMLDSTATWDKLEPQIKAAL